MGVYGHEPSASQGFRPGTRRFGGSECLPALLPLVFSCVSVRWSHFVYSSFLIGIGWNPTDASAEDQGVRCMRLKGPGNTSHYILQCLVYRQLMITAGKDERCSMTRSDPDAVRKYTDQRRPGFTKSLLSLRKPRPSRGQSGPACKGS